MNKLTTIAALPQAGGCMSSLPPEVTRWEDPRTTVMPSPSTTTSTYRVTLWTTG